MPAAKQPSRYGKHYEKAEIALIYLVDRSDTAKRLLAQLLGRTEHAIDWVWQWIHHADFPSEVHNRIQRQVEWAEQELGKENRGKIQIP